MTPAPSTTFLLGVAITAAVFGWCRRPEVVRADGPVEGESSSEFIVRSAASSSGTALLFVLNQRTKVLSLYEGEGGSRATRGLSLVASRKIERDNYVTGYNDRSEYSYQDLVKRFQLEEARTSSTGEAEDGKR